MVILPEELGSMMPCGCGNDQSQGPPEGILQRSPKQQDISQFSSSKPGALASFLSKSHVKLFAISLHNNFVVQLSEWKVNSAVPDVLPVSPVILMERQESWDGSVQFMVSVGLPHISPLLKLGAHSLHSMAKAVKEKNEIKCFLSPLVFVWRCLCSLVSPSQRFFENQTPWAHFEIRIFPKTDRMFRKGSNSSK